MVLIYGSLCRKHAPFRSPSLRAGKHPVDARWVAHARATFVIGIAFGRTLRKKTGRLHKILLLSAKENAGANLQWSNYRPIRAEIYRDWPHGCPRCS
jgi:hypothetical protein